MAETESEAGGASNQHQHESTSNPETCPLGYDWLDLEIAKSLNEHFSDIGNIIGYYTDTQSLSKLMDLLRSSGYSYSIRDSLITKRKDNDEEDIKNTIFYHLNKMPIQFFGLPFTVAKTTHYQCSFGCKYYKSRAERHPNTSQPTKKKVASKKMGCLARMTVKKVVVYPEYRLEDSKKWRKKKRLIEDLRRQLNTDSDQVKQAIRYYICMSIKSRHNHPAMIPPTTSTCRPVGAASKQETQADGVDQEEHHGYVYQESNTEQIDIDEQDDQFYKSLVKFSSNAVTYTVTTDVNPLQLTTYQIGTVADLQLIVKNKLKRIYTMCESTTNTFLLAKLAVDFEVAEKALTNDLRSSEPS